MKQLCGGDGPGRQGRVDWDEGEVESQVWKLSHGISSKVGFPGDSDNKESACNAGDQGSIPGLGRSPGEGNGNPFQYSCLENSMDLGAWWTTVHGVAKN